MQVLSFYVHVDLGAVLPETRHGDVPRNNVVANHLGDVEVCGGRERNQEHIYCLSQRLVGRGKQSNVGVSGFIEDVKVDRVLYVCYELCQSMDPQALQERVSHSCSNNTTHTHTPFVANER